MPHAVYDDANVLCPWPGCGYLIALVDFQLERLNRPDLYNRVMLGWGRRDGFGVIAPCPGCRRHVLFTDMGKVALEHPDQHDLPRLPDDWHERAVIDPNV